MDLNKLQGEQVDAMYTNTIKNMMDMGDKTNVALREYLDPIWQSTKDQRDNIAARDIALEQMNDYVASQTEKIAAGVAANFDDRTMLVGDAEFWGDAINSYVKDDGSIASEEEFVETMWRTYNHQPDKARSIYRGDKVKTKEESTMGARFDTALESFGSFWSSGGGLISTWEDQEYNLNEHAVGGRSNYGIHDVYKRAFHEYADPPRS